VIAEIPESTFRTVFFVLIAPDSVRGQVVSEWLDAVLRE